MREPVAENTLRPCKVPEEGEEEMVAVVVLITGTAVAQGPTSALVTETFVVDEDLCLAVSALAAVVLVVTLLPRLRRALPLLVQVERTSLS